MAPIHKNEDEGGGQTRPVRHNIIENSCEIEMRRYFSKSKGGIDPPTLIGTPAVTPSFAEHARF